MNPKMPMTAPGRLSTMGMVGYMLRYWAARSIASLLIRAVLWIIGTALLIVLVPLAFMLFR
jgi:hypothetical protein